MKQNLNSKNPNLSQTKNWLKFSLGKHACSVHKVQFNLYQIETIFQEIRLQKPGLLTSLIVHINSVIFLNIVFIKVYIFIFYFYKDWAFEQFIASGISQVQINFL